jgi:spermidine/putrescine transport system substrate-binding protein
MASLHGRLRAALFAGIAAVALDGAAARAAQQELNALVWCDHTAPALLEPFEKRRSS